MPAARKLPTGKVPSDVLRRVVFPYLGAKSDRVLQGPGVGEDAAVIDMGDRVVIAKANPITGAEAKIGWLAVHINAPVDNKIIRDVCCKNISLHR